MSPDHRAANSGGVEFVCELFGEIVGSLIGELVCGLLGLVCHAVVAILECLANL